MAYPPDSDGVSLLAKLVGAAAAILAPIGGLWVWIDNRFAKKQSLNSAINEVKLELGVQRGHIAKIFDVIREGEERSEARHRELLMHMLKGRGE